MESPRQLGSTGVAPFCQGTKDMGQHRKSMPWEQTSSSCSTGTFPSPHPLPWPNTPARSVLPVQPQESFENTEREHREECQELGQEHPSLDPPERRELKPAVLQAAAVPLTSVYLPGGELRFSPLVHLMATAAQRHQGLFPHQTLYCRK